MYKMIAIIGEAGSGKDTIMKKVIYEAGAAPASIFHTLTSCTTRLQEIMKNKDLIIIL
jgi:guanylate kinase